MVAVDKPNGNVAITRINTYYIYPTTYYSSSSTNEYSIDGIANSVCFYGNSVVYIHSSNGCIYKINLPGSTPVCYNASISTSTDCYYDAQTESLMLVDDYTADQKVIKQYRFADSFSYTYITDGKNVLLKN